MTDTASRARKRAHWYSPRSIGRSLVLRPRVAAGIGIGILAYLLLPRSLHPAVREASSWCLGGAAYLILAFATMWNCPMNAIRKRAARQDDSAEVILVVVLLAMFSSFAAIVGLIGEAKGASNEEKLFFVALAAATIFVSWMVTQVAFTLHYAHGYYAPAQLAEDGSTALTFPGDTKPDYWDFFYFATSLGAASQTSDVMINAKSLRRLATLHAIVSFFFNTMVLALTINLAASMA